MILDSPRAQVSKLVQQGELNIKALTHYDICDARRQGAKLEEIARAFQMSRHGVMYVIDCKCPELKK